MLGARSYSSLVILGIYCLLHSAQGRANWDPRVMLTDNSTAEERARYDCPQLQFMRCNDCRPCNDTERECRSMRKLAARCIDAIDINTDTDPDDQWSCLEKGQMLGKEQMEVAKQQLLVNCGGGGRRVKRKIRRFADFPVTKWDTKIYYKISGTLRSHEADIIRKAIALWTKDTCLEYAEEPVDMHLTKPHLVFSKVGGWGCYSYIGRSTVIPQPIYLSYNCFSSIVYIAHEIGHSLGLFHEHQRLDRNDYIKILKQSISPGAEGNFAMVLAKFIEDKNVPYDLASAMHYRAKAFSANGQNTVETTNPLYQRTIGQRVELSFADLKIINLAYCADKCAGRPLRRQCENRGYQDPKNCGRCKCPDGLAGTYCERTKVTNQCGGDLRAIPESTMPHIREVKSPGYSRGYYDVGTECSWRIKAPQGYQVKLRFRGEFGLYCFSNRCRHWVEVRTNGDLGRTGPRFCCSRTPQEILESDGNEMLVIFRSIADTRIIQQKRGFKFEYYATKKRCPNSPCRNGATCWQSSPNTQVCECRPNYYGPYCDRYGRQTTTTTTTTTPRPTTTRPTTTTTRPTTTTTRMTRPSIRNDEKSDIVILLDRSQDDNKYKPWREVTMFVRSLLQHTDLSWNRDRVGIISYAKYANVSVNLGGHSNADGIVDVVQGINLQNQEANPYKALWLMQHEVLRNRNQNRRGVPDTAIIITDSNFPDNFPQGIINQGAMQARQAGIRIISIGLGDRVLHSTLTALSGHDDNSFVLPYSRLRDAGIARNIMSRVRYLVRYGQVPDQTTTTTRRPWFKRETYLNPQRPTTTSTRRPTTTTTTTTTTRPTTTTTTPTTTSTTTTRSSRQVETCLWEKAGNCSHSCGGCGRQQWRYYCTRPNGVKTEIASREESCNEKKCQGWCLRYIGRIYYVPCGPECCGNYKPQGNRCVPDNYYRQ